MNSRYKAIIQGTNINDVFDISANLSSIDAGLGNDEIRVMGVRNTLTGGEGSDTLTIWGNRNTLTGGQDNDYLAINEGWLNYLSGGEGNDIFEIQQGNHNTLIGGSGVNQYTIQSGKENIVDNTESTDSGEYILNWKASHTQILTSNESYANTLQVASDWNVITLSDYSDDEVTFNVETDEDGKYHWADRNTLYLGDGQDTISFGNEGEFYGSNNHIFFEEGDDEFEFIQGYISEKGTLQKNIFDMGQGEDLVQAWYSKGNIFKLGDNSDELFLVQGSYNKIYGGYDTEGMNWDEDQIIVTGGSYNQIYAGKSDDIIDISAYDDPMRGNIFYGQEGSDNLRVYADVDGVTLSGGSGQDTFYFNQGVDSTDSDKVMNIITDYDPMEDIIEVYGYQFEDLLTEQTVDINTGKTIITFKNPDNTDLIYVQAYIF